MEDGVEKSYPKEGQNLWFQYDTVKELDTLMEGLNNAGIRESALYGELTKRYSDISKLIFQSRRSGNGVIGLESQESVNPKFLEGMMAPLKMKNGEDIEEENEETEEKEDRKLSDKLYKWQDSVKSAVTMSRLHVLLSIFEVCVKWEKSSENAKCKIFVRRAIPVKFSCR
ncbi:putative tyrosine-protein kinase [Apostichopus japonicus]|uniref:Putative tyrosine-protein kinase n=1 Tax=Stichopus japonicus TaxID=307972 RepID=A0A2G8KSA1_STIJA|nr:putative tyrosine-protein kinase [Apostichopus japonicus]